MHIASAAAAIGTIPAGARVVSSPGCGAPTTLLAALSHHAPAGMSLCSGLLLGEYSFLDAVRDGHMTYTTWHVMPPVRQMVADGAVSFVPARATQVASFLTDRGIDTALIRVSPPDSRGYCSLGPSVSYSADAVTMSERVIAEIDETLPRTGGDSWVHESTISVAVEAATPRPEYRRATLDAVSIEIARNLIGLIPEAPTLQIGIGAIPEAFVEELISRRTGGLRFAGMATDGMAELGTRDLLDVAPSGVGPAIRVAELMGSGKLMGFADCNSALEAFTARNAIDPRALGPVPRLICINSAVEVDLHGQVNAEWAAGSQLSGAGGSVDFFEGARASEGGMRIIALPSVTNRDGTSRIVANLAAGTPVTVPRHSVDVVVTEWGIAHIANASTRERAERLAAIAHPDHRSGLYEAAYR
jgi:4-hydroxybutyrate CoA-transferase